MPTLTRCPTCGAWTYNRKCTTPHRKEPPMTPERLSLARLREITANGPAYYPEDEPAHDGAEQTEPEWA